MPIHDWFNIKVKKHYHIWGPWIQVDEEILKYNHRAIRGKIWTFKRVCETCGETDYQSKEQALNLTS